MTTAVGPRPRTTTTRNADGRQQLAQWSRIPEPSKRFTRQDGVKQGWRVMQPLLDQPPPVHRYAKGSWGPEAFDEVLAGHGQWHHPWVAS
jgi:glucose-6-phosphate dehydrogenase-like protein